MEETWFKALFVLTSVLVIIILIIVTMIAVKVYKTVCAVRRITEQAESLVDKADHVADFFQKTATPVAIMKLVSNITDTFNSSKKKGKMKKKTVALGATLIAGASYVAGVLTAPKSGKETRKDIKDKAVKTKTEAEKKLKKVHSDLQDLIKKSEDKAKGASDKSKVELKKATEKAKKAKDKTKEMLSAVHSGEADDKHLMAALEEAKLAKKNLQEFFKK